ncbi:hypothetical protein NLI96_g5080 [Meripilus lineatus]|uniref:F-box domain-containing protein n=1 Tax=Meripilus lineatus TaxID=2056292 RepID=A0AAD5V8C9_9APHY|nr:hypothetical protein NLI96_g5080 [Physisporinus lineatus]
MHSFVAPFVLFISSLFVLGTALPVFVRDVFVPPVTYPHQGTVWVVGQKHNVTWDTSNPPKSITNPKGRIILAKGGLLNLSNPLATNFTVMDGRIEITVPNVPTGDDYSCLAIQATPVRGLQLLSEREESVFRVSVRVASMDTFDFEFASLFFGDWTLGLTCINYMKELPTELVSLILYHLDQDTESLSSCSLVSKAWSQESRRYLFDQLIIRTSTSQELEDFAQFLALAHNLGHLIRTLRLLSDNSLDRYDLSLFLLATILQHLPNLQHLSICHFTLEHDITNLNAYAETSFSTLQTLRVGGPFPSVVSRTLFGWFPSLKELHLFGYTPTFLDDDDYFDPTPSPIRGFRLQVLSAGDYTDESVQGTLGDLVAGGCLSSLRTLDLGVDEGFDLLGFGDVLRAINGSLRELSLNIPFNPGDMRIQWEEMNLQKCTSLETLKFSIEVVSFMENRHLRPNFEDVLRIIRILNQSPIRDVTICIEGEYPTTLAGHLEEHHWEEMQTLLLSMPAIRSLTFLGDIAAWDLDLITEEDLMKENDERNKWVPLPKRIEDRFASHLPRLLEEGILKYAPREEWGRE